VPSTLAVAVADTNGDGVPDIIAGDGGDASVLFGNGDGTFTRGPSSTLTMINGTSFAAADVSGDGKVDLVLVGGWQVKTPPEGIGVCLGNGDGTFQQPVYYRAGDDKGLYRVVIGDFNGDGIPDAATVGDKGLWMFIGTGGGKFKPGVLTPLSHVRGAIRVLATGDLNGDGKLDVVVARRHGFAVLLGNGDGTFQAPKIFDTNLAPFQILVGDVNGDGHPDILVQAGRSDYASIFFGDGLGGFAGPTHVYLPGPRLAALADVNGDRIPDLVNLAAYVEFGKGGGTFGAPVYYPIQSGADGGGVYNMVAADLRRNGLMDLVVQGAASVVSVLLNQGNGTYEDGVPTPVSGGAGCGAAADYNGDGKPDLALISGSDQTVAVLLGTGKAEAPFTLGPTFPVTYPGCPVSGDLNGDGIPDLVVPISYPPPATDGAVAAYLGNGDGTFTLKSTTPVPTGNYYLALADFNRDGHLDFATAGNVWALGNGDGTFQSPTPLIQDFPYCGFTFIASGDVNNDGWPDVVISCYSLNTIYVLLNDRSGGFTETTFETGEYEAPGGILLADLNGDGNLDAIVPEVYGGVLVYLGDGQGGFTQGQILSGPIGPGTIAVADLNGDGIPDIAYDEQGSVAIFLGNGDGTFAAPFYLGTGPYPTDLFALNLHGQPRSAGVPDIVEPDSVSGVYVLVNTAKAPQ
jgi:VCBS repeat protein